MFIDEGFTIALNFDARYSIAPAIGQGRQDTPIATVKVGAFFPGMFPKNDAILSSSNRNEENEEQEQDEDDEDYHTNEDQVNEADQDYELDEDQESEVSEEDFEVLDPLEYFSGTTF